jgi:hypothetical protein
MLKLCPKCLDVVMDEDEYQCPFCQRKRKAHLLLLIRRKRNERLNFQMDMLADHLDFPLCFLGDCDRISL